MQKLLYLDTARLGQMSPRACRASVDFARFASECGGSLYFSDFLSDGYSENLNEFEQLRGWKGIAGLKSHISRLAGADIGTEVIIAARSSMLLKLAARNMASACRNVLISDCCWPVYEQIMARALATTGAVLTKVRLRSLMFEGCFDRDRLVKQIHEQYIEHQCDGLFLPAVDNLGIHLPVSEIVASIRSETQLRFVAVDAAQAINHVPIASALRCCDFMIAGCHKWVGGFNPLGIGLTRNGWSKQGTNDDPLHSFSLELEHRRHERFGESVAVAPLITANAAVEEANEQAVPESVFEKNRDCISELAALAGWRLASPNRHFESRILLLQSPIKSTQSLSAEQLQRKFVDRGVALTAYRQGLVRISLPSECLDDSELGRLCSALTACR